jgi:hypothetical protein
MVDGTLRALKTVKVKDSGGVLRTVFSGLKVSSNFSVFSGFGNVEPIIATPTCVVTPSGGTAPYSYAWTLVGGDNNGVSVAIAPTSNATAFRATGLSEFVPHEAIFRCTVTDSGGVTGSVEVSVTFTKFGGIL